MTLAHHAFHLGRELPAELLLQLGEDAALVVVAGAAVKQQPTGQPLPARDGQRNKEGERELMRCNEMTSWLRSLPPIASGQTVSDTVAIQLPNDVKRCNNDA